jgi:hypothetical protein
MKGKMEMLRMEDDRVDAMTIHRALRDINTCGICCEPS